MKIFVADDYENFRILLADVLRHDGEEVREFRDGATLLSAVLAEAPDIVVAELRLPVITALDVLVTLRARNVRVPMIVTTSVAPEDFSVDRAHHGPVRVLRKPFVVDQLRSVMSEILKSER